MTLDTQSSEETTPHTDHVGKVTDMVQSSEVEELVKQYASALQCFDSYCDKNGTTVTVGTDGIPEPVQCEYCYRERFPAIENFRTTLTNLTAQNEACMREMVEDILKLADALEMECGKDGDKGTKQWMAFKGFRNTVKDRYLPTNPGTK